jgi:hypothetical protein
MKKPALAGFFLLCFQDRERQLCCNSCPSLVVREGQVMAESVSTDCKTGTSGVAAFTSFAGRQGTVSFGGIPAVEWQFSVHDAWMSGSAHEPAVQRKFLLVLKVLKVAVYSPAAHR